MSVIGNAILVGGGGGSDDTFAFISVTYPAGSTCTATNGTKTLTAPDTSGIALFRIPTPTSLPESWTVSCTDGTQLSNYVVTLTQKGQGEIIELMYLVLESFSTISDSNFVKLIQAAHSNEVDLQQNAGWRIGDKRTISISAFTDGGNISHSAQDIDIVIGSFDDYENCGCVMQFDFADAIATGSRLGSTTNNGGYAASLMYRSTLPALTSALPAYLHDLLIPFSCKTSAGNKSTTIETINNNKLALRSEFEIFGAHSNSVSGEGIQIPYYITSANRIKKRGHSGTADTWWERSPVASSGTYFCYVDSSGAMRYGRGDNSYGLAPFGCI